MSNLSFIKKIKDLEELLDSKLSCTFFLIPDVKICGKYKNKKIEFISFLYTIYRRVHFVFVSDKLPKQKKFLLDYPKFGKNVYIRGNKIIYYIPGWNYRFYKLGKPGFTAILDEFLDVIEKLEHAEENVE